ncbi:MAG: helix-turn-helix domain-containing protein, partial [Cyanobacteria bacterium P01_A01_bin.135]
MPPKRLSSSEKQEILQLYRQPEETTSTLASRFGVSSSTVSRILKQGLSSEEYDILVQQKRTGVPRPMPAAA